MENDNLTNNKVLSLPLLTGGGEVGRLCRAKDWSKTQLGDIIEWPASLRTAMQIMLNSRQSLWMGWGRDLVFLYNDSYISTLGIKHPEALGKPAREVWSEIWKDIGPMLQSVWDTGKATWSENLLLFLERSGFPEETYHTFSYSPIYNETGEIAGIFTAVLETTKIVQGERELRTLKDLGNNITGKKADSDVFKYATDVLKESPEDFPFTIIYKQEGDALVLQSSSQPFSTAVMPAVIERGEAFPWPLFDVLNQNEIKIADNYSSLVSELSPVRGTKVPTRSLLIPVSQSRDKSPDTILIVGANPYRQLEEKYLDFFKLIGDQVSVGINNARTYEEERKRADQLAEIDKAKTIFFSNISHEFRTPLTLMLSPLEELMQSGEALPAPARKNIEISHRNSLRLLKLVNTLLDFSRIEAGKMEPRFEPLDVPAYTIDLASSFRSAIEKAGIKLVVDCEPTIEFVYIDQDMWEKIVLNLLSNAFKYTHKGMIEVRLRHHTDHIELVVKDTGIGIPEEEHEKIFSRFHRIDNVGGRSQEGTGIGLALVQELVKLHQGTISLKSRPGEGSEFTVCIPSGAKNRKQGTSAKPRLNLSPTGGENPYVGEAMQWLRQAVEDKSVKPSGNTGKQKPYVLLADDNADMRAYINKILSDEFEVMAVPDGKKALEAIQERLPDLLISDVMMPGMNGFELIKKIRAGKDTAKLPIILLSARAGEEARVDGIGSGANDYLVKPFSQRELVARVRSQVTNSRLRNETDSRLAAFFQQAPMAICVFRGPTHIVEVINERMLKIWGKRLEDVINRPVFEGMPDATGQGYEEVLESVYKTGRRFVTDELPVNLLREGKNEKIFLKFVCEPYREEDGSIAGVIAVADEITENVANREKTAESEIKYRQLVESLPVAIYTCDKEGRITFFNDIAVKLWGYTPDISDETLRYCACKSVWLDDGTFVMPEETPIAMALKTGRSFRNVEALVEKFNGEKFSSIVNVDPLFDKEGNLTGAINIFQDITPRKKIETELQASEARFRNLIQGLPAAFYTTDVEGRITLYNEAAVKLWGRKPEAGKDMWWWSYQIFEPDGVTELPHDKTPMAIALKEQRRVIVKEPLTIRRYDGTIRYIIPHPDPLFDAGGNLVGAVNMLVDVTDSKLAEEQNGRLAAIVESSGDAIVSKTLNSVVTSWNDAAQRIFGYSAEEMIGETIFKLIPDDRHSEEAHILARIRKGERLEHFETKRLTRSGRLIDVSLTISAIRDSNGRIIGASKIARDITQQKETERIIHESEERMRMAIESTHIGTWEYHPSSEKLVWSNECKKIYGLDLDAEPDNGFVDACHLEEDKEKIHQNVMAAMNPEGGGDFYMQYQIIRQNDKQLRWVNVQGKVFFNTDKQPERFIGTILDITDEKTREDQLKESVELFQTMADNVPAMIWMSGTDKFNDYFNRTWLEFTGRTLEQESNEGWLDGVHPDDVQSCLDTYNRSYKEQAGFYTEYRLLRHDGQYRWIADNCTPRFSLEGEFVGYISACIDIDDQKTFREKIRASELLFKTISNAAPVGLWMTDTRAQNTFVNDTWIEWTGLPFEKQLGTGWLDAVLEEDKVDAPQKFQEALQKEEKYSTEFRIRGTDGEIRWCLTEGYPYYDANDQLVGYAGSVTDITEIKKLEQRKDDFIKMASHELKTPVTSINGYVQLLLNIYQQSDNEKLQASKETVRSSLGTISRQVSKLTRLIADLFDISKIESDKLALDKTEFNLDELMNEIVQEVRYTASRHAIILKSDFKKNIYADKDRLAQVITNLLGNAIKYSPEADKVEVKVSGKGEMVNIQVKDYGIGIDENELGKIFERFYRVGGKNEQTYPGFGIGLFIASEIIHRHGGTISVNSQKGKGSVFTVSLPSGIIKPVKK